MPRIGILALIQESNTFLPGATTLEHFRRELLLTGEAVRTQFMNAHHEVRGFFDGLKQAGFDSVPLFAARALPFGTIQPDAFDTLVQMLLHELTSAGPLDGLLVTTERRSRRRIPMPTEPGCRRSVASWDRRCRSLGHSIPMAISHKRW